MSHAPPQSVSKIDPKDDEQMAQKALNSDAGMALKEAGAAKAAAAQVDKPSTPPAAAALAPAVEAQQEPQAVPGQTTETASPKSVASTTSGKSGGSGGKAGAKKRKKPARLTAGSKKKRKTAAKAPEKEKAPSPKGIPASGEQLREGEADVMAAVAPAVSEAGDVPLKGSDVDTPTSHIVVEGTHASEKLAAAEAQSAELQQQRQKEEEQTKPAQAPSGDVLMEPAPAASAAATAKAPDENKQPDAPAPSVMSGGVGGGDAPMTDISASKVSTPPVQSSINATEQVVPIQ